ncbi:hypothetical protein ABMA27_014338 [Loxostege sticticalis]|uniref:Reverse transcriptase n=1 Tax=Loxostege sticticalis TaxID=481309 RepID=A0ABR3I8M1_LOXSC
MVLLSASICGLRRLVSICEEYATSHGLVYNVDKSQVMVFGAGSKRYENIPPIKINNNTLQRVLKFKYLGHMLTPDLKDDEDIERERRALSYNNAFRVLLRLPRFCSASGMFAEADVDCFYASMRKRCASLVRRVRESGNSILNMIAGRLDCIYVRRSCAMSGGVVQNWPL